MTKTKIIGVITLAILFGFTLGMLWECEKKRKTDPHHHSIAWLEMQVRNIWNEIELRHKDDRWVSND